MKVGDRVRIKPRIWDDERKIWTFEGCEKRKDYGWIGVLERKQISNHWTVRIKANTNAGYLIRFLHEDEMEVVSENAPVYEV